MIWGVSANYQGIAWLAIVYNAMAVMKPISLACLHLMRNVITMLVSYEKCHYRAWCFMINLITVPVSYEKCDYRACVL